MLQQDLCGPTGVDSCKLLVGLDAVVVDGEELTLFSLLGDVGESALVSGCLIGWRGGGVGFGFESVMLCGESCDIRLSLLLGHLSELVASVLLEPCTDKASESSILLCRDYSDFALLVSLGIVFCHGCFVSGELLLDAGTFVARGASKILLGVVELVLVEAELLFGDLQIAGTWIGSGWIGGRGSIWGQVLNLGLIVFDELLQLNDSLR